MFILPAQTVLQSLGDLNCLWNIAHSVKFLLLNLMNAILGLWGILLIFWGSKEGILLISLTLQQMLEDKAGSDTSKPVKKAKSGRKWMDIFSTSYIPTTFRKHNSCIDRKWIKLVSLITLFSSCWSQISPPCGLEVAKSSHKKEWDRRLTTANNRQDWKWPTISC